MCVFACLSVVCVVGGGRVVVTTKEKVQCSRNVTMQRLTRN